MEVARNNRDPLRGSSAKASITIEEASAVEHQILAVNKISVVAPKETTVEARDAISKCVKVTRHSLPLDSSKVGLALECNKLNPLADVQDAWSSRPSHNPH